MIFKFSLFVLALALVNVNAEELKTCKTQGFNGAILSFPYSFPFLNAEDKTPIQLNARHTDDFERICPNLKTGGLSCADPEQLQYLEMTVDGLLKLDDDSCEAALHDIHCHLYANPNQNRYVNVIKKSKSFLKYYDNKIDVDTISAKVDLQFVDEFFNNCRNVSMPAQENKTLEELFDEKVSYRLLWAMFNNGFMNEVDFRFYDQKTNETFHLVRNVLGVIHKLPIEDNSIQTLPLVFNKLN